MRPLSRLWHEETGVVSAGQIILLTAILVIGVLVGLQTARDSLVQELGDLASALETLNQSYSFSVGTCVSTYTDFPDATTPVAAGDCIAVGFTDATAESSGPGSGSPPAGIGFGAASSE